MFRLPVRLPAPTTRPRQAACRVLLAAAILAAAGTAVADDRDLLGRRPASPYAFIILDTSGSMNWTTACSERDDFADVDPWDGGCTRECPLEDAVCQRLDPEGPGCVEYSAGSDGVLEIILDEEDSGAEVAVSGGWTPMVSGAPFVGSRYIHDANADKGSRKVTFSPVINVRGYYHVYLFYTADPTNADHVPVKVSHVGGTEIYHVDQTRNTQEDADLDRHPGVDPEHYNYLGTFLFDPGVVNKVEISNAGTTGRVVVDTARFVAAREPSGVSCNRTAYRIRQPLCPRGDCYPRLNADDPTSKMFQIREGMYEVLDRVGSDQVQFGFGSYEQDDAYLRGKHWLYRVAEFDATGTRQPFFTAELPSTGEFPVPGSLHVFGLGAPYDSAGDGDGWECTTNDGIAFNPATEDPDLVGCLSGALADADDLWEMERARRLPKFGLGNATTPAQWNPTVVFYREPTDTVLLSAGQKYLVTYTRRSGNYGDPIMEVDVRMQKCAVARCSSFLSDVTRTFRFELVSDYSAFEFVIGRDPMRQNGYYHVKRNVAAQASSIVANHTGCEGLEPNDDRLLSGTPTRDDDFQGYTHKWPTISDPDGRDARMSVGDFVPFDWERDHRELLMGRMAPNLYRTTDGLFDASLGKPDFRTATYWQDRYQSGDNPNPNDRKLRLKDDKRSAFISFGATPLANSLADFKDWYVGSDGTSGFRALAAVGDARLGCRQSFVIFLTDGNETCSTVCSGGTNAGESCQNDTNCGGGGTCVGFDAPCTAAANLFALDPPVKTFVVGFGLDDSESNLSCIAQQGGTEAPILPRNKNELVAALTDIFQAIVPAPSTFASASIPAVQSSSADKIYFSSFVPLPTNEAGSQAVWPGRLSAFRKPLPLNAEGQPDATRQCTNLLQSGCHLWDAGRLLVEQAPTNPEIDDPMNPIFRIGPAMNQRRVFYPAENPGPGGPSELTLFRLPESLAECQDLKSALLPNDPACAVAEDPDLVAIQKQVLRRKPIPSSIADLFGSQTEYVLGDVFHADPVVIDAPNDFVYFANDLCGILQSAGLPNNCVANQDRGYRQFVQKHVWRRKLLVAATNDGQLHFFEAGTRRKLQVTLPDGQVRDEEVFTDGTGRELFSYMPRLTLPVVGKQFELGNSEHIYTTDGTVSLRDVFIDSVADAFGNYDPAQREWRTVMVAGLREAGDRFEPTRLAVLDVDEDDGFVPGYFALDVTQPDVLKRPDTNVIVNTPLAVDVDDPLIPIPENQELPSCLSFNYSGDGRQTTAANCSYPFPMELWTFIDAVDNRVLPPVNGKNDLLNEDWDADGDGDGPGDGEAVDPDNNQPDLGETWSRPVIGQIAFCDLSRGTRCDPNAPDPVDPSLPDPDEHLSVLHVAIFGGGMDPNKTDAMARGNWLYMVDVETGDTVYKRRLDAAAPASPAVLDTNRDGIFDAIFIGTINGTLYKVDLTQTNPDGNLPGLDDTGVTDMLGNVHVRQRIDDDPVPGDPLGLRMWDPRPILKTRDHTPIYQAPAPFFIPEIERWGLALGTGDRENITDNPDTNDFPGRFYVFVDGTCNRDTNDDGLTDEPIDDVASPLSPCLFELDLSDPANPPPLRPDNENLLVDRGGWAINVGTDFRMSNRPFLVFGVLIFSMFNSEAVPVFDAENNRFACTNQGVTRSFVVRVQNGNPIVDFNDPVGVPPPPPPPDPGDGGVSNPPPPEAEDRFVESADLTTAPFVDTVGTKNPQPGAGRTLGDDFSEAVGSSVRKFLIDQFPRGSRFNLAHQQAVMLSLRTTGTEVLVTVPVVIFPADWNEP